MYLVKFLDTSAQNYSFRAANFLNNCVTQLLQYLRF